MGDGDDAARSILARSVPAEGRSRAWVDGRMAPLGALAEAGGRAGRAPRPARAPAPWSTPAAQRDVLDAFAGIDLEPGAGRRAASCARSTRRWRRSGGDAQQRAREADLLRYQVEEIDAAHLEDPDEDAALRLEEDRLADAAAHREAALRRRSSWSTRPATGGAARPARAAAGGALAGREALRAATDARLAAAAVELSDLARTLRDVVETWEDDPERLATSRRAGGCWPSCGASTARTWRAVLAFAAEARGPAGRARGRRGRGGPAAGRARPAAAPSWPRPRRRCARSGRRAAGAFGERSSERLGALAMAEARLEVPVAAEGPGEAVELPLGANPGEAGAAPGPGGLGRRAGPGHAGPPPGRLGGPPDDGLRRGRRRGGRRGRAGGGRGAARGRPATTRCSWSPTWPRWPSQADAQISVRKRRRRGRTVTTATALEGEDRVVELSRMLSGHPDSDAGPAPRPRSCSGADAHGPAVHHAVAPPSIIVVGCTDHVDVMLGVPKAA